MIKYFIKTLIFGAVVLSAFIAISFLLREDSHIVASQAFEAINEHREGIGISVLLPDEELAIFTLKHSQLMNDTGKFEHSGFPGENILRGRGSFYNGQSIVGEWMKSPLHRLNLMREDIRYGAVGVVGNYATFMAR